MALYPVVPVPRIPYTTSDTYFTITSGQFESGVMNTRSGRVYPLFSVKLAYNIQDWGNFGALYVFFVSMKGRAGTFTYKDFLGWDKSPVGIAWPKLYALTETTTTTNKLFDVPMFGSTSYTLYENGVTIVADASNPPAAGKFYFSAGTGTDGRDQVKMNTTAGRVYEWAATGQRGVIARFLADTMSWDSFMSNLTQGGLMIEEAR